MTINFIKRNSFATTVWKTLNVIVGVSTILNVSMVGALMVPTTARAIESTDAADANDAVCPAGNVKYEVGSGGYEYTDGSGTVSVVSAGSHNKATWTAASGKIITAVCIKIGGSGGGTLIYPDPASGQGGPYSHDISHVVLYTRTTSNQCALYGMHDQNTVDSLLFKINPTNGQFTQIGSVREGYDIEAMDAHPDTEVMYGMSGAEDAPATMKRILIIDPVTGIPDISTGVQLTIGSNQEIQGASFNPVTKELWVSGDHGFDIRTLNYTTGVSTPKKTVSGSPEALAWNANGTTLYYTVNHALNSYNPSTNSTASVCSNLGGEMEGMEFDDLGNLIIGIHGDTKLYKVNPQTCAKTPYYQLGAFDDVETLTSACPKPVATELTVIKHVVGGTATAANFTMQIGTAHSFPGSEQGTTTSVNPGSYTISETGGPSNYVASFSGDCSTSGHITLQASDQKTCTVTNTFAPSHIVVAKHLDTNGDGTADLTSSDPLLGGWEFAVNGTTNPSNQTTSNLGMVTFNPSTGTYSVTEVASKPNTRLASAVCLNGSTPVGTVNLQTRTVSGLNLGTNETINCTFVNAATTGTLRVIKHVVGGTATAANFTMHIKQSSVDVVTPFPGSEAGATYTLLTGTYQVSESDLPSGYTQTSIICDGQATSSVNVVAGQTKTCTLTNTSDTVRVPNPPLRKSCGLDIGLVVDRSGSVDSGEMSQMKTALTNFANAFTGTPTVFSLTSFATNSTLNRAFSRSPAEMAGDVASDIPSSGSGHTNWDAGLAQSSGSFDPRPAKADLIVIATDGSPNRFGYPVTDPTFDLDLGLAHAIDRANAIKTDATRIVVVGIGEDTTDPATPAQKLDKMKAISGDNVATTPDAITTSTDVIKVSDFNGIGSALSAFASELCGGKILVQKQFDANGDGDLTDPGDLDGSTTDPLLDRWQFDVAGSPSDPSAQTTTNTGALEFDVLNGTYSLTELNLKPNTALTSIACVKGNHSVGSVDLNTRTVSGLSMSTDETISCRFVNSVTSGDLKVIKHVVNDNGGTKQVADFPLFVNATPVTSGVQNGFNAGQYTVSETNQAGYVATISGDCASNGSITLNPGDVKSCTITNDDQAAHLVVIKQVINNDGGTKVAADFTLTINGLTVPSGATFASAPSPGVDKVVHPGTYSVTETPVVGYAASFSPECSGTIALGQTKTCTVTNDDIKPVIAVDKTGPATVNAGDNITYTIAWSVSATPVTNAVISDTIPTNTSFVSAGCGTTTGTCIVNSATSTITWSLGSRNPGESGTVALTVKSSSPLTNGTVMTNTGVFDTDQTEPVSDTVTTTVSSLPVLGIQKSATPTTVPAGQNVTWTMKWSVSGNSIATNVVIVDPIPANSTFVSVADAGVYDALPNKITWNLGTQSPGASGEVHYVVKTASPIANNTVITNTATIDSVETDPPFAASASVTVTSAPDLTITKVNDVQTFTNPGKALTYTVTVTNKATATDTAKNVVLTDTLPAGFTFAVDGTTTKSFTIGNLTPGQSATVTYLVNISGTQAAGTFNNLAKAKGNNTNEVNAVAAVEVRVPIVLGIEALPDLTIEKTASKTTAKPGDVITYTITVRNTGDADAKNVVITDTLPKNLSFVHAKGRTMQWNIGTLAPGRSRVIDVDVRVESDAKKGDYVNVATVAADDLPQKEAQAKITVRVPKVLGLAKTGPGTLDLMIAFIGITLIALGVLGLRRRETAQETVNMIGNDHKIW